MKHILHLLVVFCILFPLPHFQTVMGTSQTSQPSGNISQANPPGLPAGVDADWLHAAQENIRRSEYHLSLQEGTYLASNRAQHLKIAFTPSEVRITPHNGRDTWEWGLRLMAYGYRNDLQTVGKPTRNVSKNRITYRRDSLDEWYVNRDSGLEQGFTLYAPPAGLAANEIVLELALLGTLIPQMSTDGATIELRSQEGVRVLQFGRLHAFDAHQASLPTRMELNGNRLQLRVEVANAAYPITVDPLATSPSWSMESNQASAQLGFAAASAGDVNGDGYDDIIISAPYFDASSNGGRVFVFLGSSSGPSATAAWTATGGQANAQFGWSAASAGDFNGDGYADVVIGARSYDNGQADEGAAFIWYGSSTGLDCGSGCPTSPISATWSAEGNQAGSGFGFAVAAAGDVNGDGYADILIGAPDYENDSPSEESEGWAFLYQGGSTPDAAADWTASSNQANATFGHAVASAGDFNGDGYADVIVGAYRFDNSSYTDDGSAYLWFGSASGLGVAGTPANAAWSVTGGQNNAQLGTSVVAAGDVNGDGYGDLLIGAPGYTDTISGEGRVFVYHGGGTPNTVADWRADGEQASSAFGVAVASAGDTNGDGYADIVVGADLYNRGFSGEGVAFAWFGSGSGLGADGSPANADWSVAGGQANAYLGAAVGSAGDVNGDGYSDLIVGAPGYTNFEASEGQARVFYGGSYSVFGNITQYAWEYHPNRPQTWLGSTVASAGDINGDGYGDVMVCAFYYDNTANGNQGATFVFYGSANGLSTSPNWYVVGNEVGDTTYGNLGSVAGSAGDVNADGYGDILIGAYFQDNGQENEGMVFVWYGSASGLSCGTGCPVYPSSANWSAQSDQANAQFGVSAGTAGDINGDGYGDVIVGARNYDVGALVDAGAAFAWYGSPTGLACATGCPVAPTSANWQVEGDQANALLGNQAAYAGDVNADGYADVIVGGHQYDDGQSNEGKAFVWHGSALGINEGVAGTTSNAMWSAQGNQVDAGFGYTVTGVGDVNGDGYDDVFIGARYYDNGQTDEGSAFVWHGSANGVNNGTNGSPGNEAWRAEADLNNTQFSYSTSGPAGDVNGDGYNDIIIGASQYANPQSYEGAAFLWLGSSNGVNNDVNGTPSNANWGVESNTIGDYLGLSVSTAGDVNGDGYDDVILGSPRYNVDNAVQGRAYLYYGNAADGISVLPRQRRADNTQDIAPGGQAISPDSVRLSLWARSPLGRGNVRLQWEIKPAGTAFDGAGLGQSAAWSDSGASGITLNELVTGLTMDTRYHWRIRLQAQPRNADADLVSYRGPWIEGGTFFTALSGTQDITGAGLFHLLGQSASITVTNQGNVGNLLTSLALRGYPRTAHTQENSNGGGPNMLNRYFTLTPNVGASGYNVTLCLHYQDSEVPSGFDDSQLRLCRWTGTDWACPNRASSSSTANNLVCAENVTAFSDWVIGADLGPTAIELTHFQVQAGTQANLGLPLGLIVGLNLLLFGRSFRRKQPGKRQTMSL